MFCKFVRDGYGVRKYRNVPKSSLKIITNRNYLPIYMGGTMCSSLFSSEFIWVESGDVSLLCDRKNELSSPHFPFAISCVIWYRFAGSFHGPPGDGLSDNFLSQVHDELKKQVPELAAACNCLGSSYKQTS